MATFYEQRPERLFIGEMTHSTFPAHVHSEAELVILARGSAVMTIDGVPYRLSPGDAAVVSPLVTHSYDELSEDVGGLVAIFPPDIMVTHDRNERKTPQFRLDGIHGIGEHLPMHVPVTAVSLDKITDLESETRGIIRQAGRAADQARAPVPPHLAIAGKLPALYPVEPFHRFIIA